ncbi:MAG: hypothetical protein N5P05_001607 [Chroococcopsis gigantea SAG 12.99]|jgi:putative component of toxin-antitoxin plasmid stabilization module|nr:hypothetical protein [Chroococcopsis gigantea SAG 12.99]
MEPIEIEIALKAAFKECEQSSCPLTEAQKQIILQNLLSALDNAAHSEGNPLDELTLEERQLLLTYIAAQEGENLDWKAGLLNDWLNDRSSGSIQFIRENYGFSWLNRVRPIHWQEYLKSLRLKREKLQLGDTIEVSNGLWEWVQDEGPCYREWYSCQVISLSETNCTVRFADGTELEIPALYQWNRCNWRFPE